MPNFTTISSLARKHGIRPREISDLFYQRKLSDKRCPIVDGRRLIPESYVGKIESLLRERGVIKAAAEELATA